MSPHSDKSADARNGRLDKTYEALLSRPSTPTVLVLEQKPALHLAVMPQVNRSWTN